MRIEKVPLSDAQHNGGLQPGPVASPHPNLNRFLLPNGEYVACVFWNGLYHITGTDIGKHQDRSDWHLCSNSSVRALVFRFEAFSRPVQNLKKSAFP
jgi:transcription factor STE12